jgi:hypothetical protein
MADKFFCNNHAEKKHIFAASSVIRVLMDFVSYMTVT